MSDNTKEKAAREDVRDYPATHHTPPVCDVVDVIDRAGQDKPNETHRPQRERNCKQLR